MTKTINAFKVTVMHLSGEHNPDRGKWVMDVTASFEEKDAQTMTCAVMANNMTDLFWRLPKTVDELCK